MTASGPQPMLAQNAAMSAVGRKDQCRMPQSHSWWVLGGPGFRDDRQAGAY